MKNFMMGISGSVAVAEKSIGVVVAEKKRIQRKETLR